MRLITLISGLLTLVATVTAQDETGDHPNWPRWCGKVYESGYPSFEPGGHTTAPPDNGSTYLYVQFKPRYSIYLDGETTASFVVNAALSPWYGGAWTNSTTDGTATQPFTDLVFSINVAGNNTPLVKSSISINETGIEFEFDLSAFEPSLTPYDVVLSGSSVYEDHIDTAASSFLYLPDNPSGSATKIDNLNGGLLFKNAATNNSFVPLLPYGYYGWYNGSTVPAEADAFVHEYTSNGEGLNAIIALANYTDTNPVYDSMDEFGLHYMFDLRSSYKNLTETETRVNTIKGRSSLFAYWTADEPDGQQVPFNTTPAAQSLIHTLDPYHPVAITLNCQDFYFGAYAAGGDILMADPYPIGTSYALSKWGTTCNATLGDCGCDNCAGTVQDVPSRLDDLAMYESWLGRWPLPRFFNPQVFHGEDYWARDPTPGEARVMNALAFSRGATGIFGWTWPSSDVLFATHSEMAAVVTASPVREFLLGGKAEPLTVEGTELLDAAYWVQGERMMVSVVNGGYVDVNSTLAVELPVAATGFEAVPFGGLSWRLVSGRLTVDRLPAMSSSFIILGLEVTG
ncbi:Uu.00g006050.m01.CDS01 [Anthostomella pinea]|uniref:Uu.00g006050.m01.CDS01 n=1 Tax=Anthostomella pinea TaxID=933095 RepID=A0AAI8VLE0_9PEZI|nr:Uu.00g006050.m01.CDS01 [Anthostomella pinea]